MITLKKITIDGFCSIGHFETNLDQNQVVIIRGNTGAGKTTFISAIVWALYGKTLKDTNNVNTLKEFQQKGYKGTKVSLYFEKDKKLHKVTRCSNYTGIVDSIKGGNNLFYYNNGELIEEKSKVNIQKEIEKELGMSYQLFVSSIVFGQGLKRFIQETGPEKRSILEEAFDIQYLQNAREKASGILDDLKDKFHEIQTKISNLIYKEDVERKYIEESESIAQKQNDDRKEDLSKIKSKIRELIESIPDVDYKSDLKEIENKVQSLKDKIQSCKDVLTESKQNISMDNMKKSLENILKYLQKNEINKAFSKVEELIHSFTLFNTVNQKIDRFNLKIEKYREKYSEIQRKENKIKQIQNEINVHKEHFKRLKNKEVPTIDIESKKKYLEELKSQRDKINIKLEPLKKSIQDLEWAYSEVLGNMGIKSYIIDSSLNEINKYLETYADVLGFTVQFDIDLDSARKEIKQLVMMDNILISYADLSGGQKQLCNLATAFALNEFMNYHHGVNIAFLDEIFENLDRNCLEIVSNLITQIYKDRTLYIVTHHDTLPIQNSKVIRVVRNNGLSEYL